MKLINWIKHKLFLHAPLWLCLSLALVVDLLLPEAISQPIVLVIFFAYFIARYLWRRHLKKTEQLGRASSGMVSLVFFGLIAAVMVYDKVVPDSPKLVLYQTQEPDVFETIDHFHEATETDDKAKDDGLPLRRKEKKGVLSGALAAGFNGITDRLFACSVVFKREGVAPCEGVTVKVARISLDSDGTTVELLLSDKKPEECVSSA